MIRLLSLPAFPVVGDQIAMALRAFDHWQKHVHVCEHDEITDCIDDYARGEGDSR